MIGVRIANLKLESEVHREHREFTEEHREEIIFRYRDKNRERDLKMAH